MSNHKVTVDLVRGSGKEKPVREDIERAVEKVRTYEERCGRRPPSDDQIRSRISGYAEADNQKGKWK